MVVPDSLEQVSERKIGTPGTDGHGRRRDVLRLDPRYCGHDYGHLRGRVIVQQLSPDVCPAGYGCRKIA
jgi:hypothetical protein